jgi:hypothetical protein
MDTFRLHPGIFGLRVNLQETTLYRFPAFFPPSNPGKKSETMSMSQHTPSHFSTTSTPVP